MLSAVAVGKRAVPKSSRGQFGFLPTFWHCGAARSSPPAIRPIFPRTISPLSANSASSASAPQLVFGLESESLQP
jgi:hypothetical protein